MNSYAILGNNNCLCLDKVSSKCTVCQKKTEFSSWQYRFANRFHHSTGECTQVVIVPWRQASRRCPEPGHLWRFGGASRWQMPLPKNGNPRNDFFWFWNVRLGEENTGDYEEEHETTRHVIQSFLKIKVHTKQTNIEILCNWALRFFHDGLQWFIKFSRLPSQSFFKLPCTSVLHVTAFRSSTSLAENSHEANQPLPTLQTRLESRIVYHYKII